MENTVVTTKPTARNARTLIRAEWTAHVPSPIAASVNADADVTLTAAEIVAYDHVEIAWFTGLSYV